MYRSLFAIATLVLLSACGAAPVAQMPVEVTRVVTQVVTREVVRVETQVVVVTPTGEPATATPQPTLEPTATAEPTLAPLPTAIPEPTAVPMLEPGEWVEGEIVRTIDVYDIPNEFAGHAVIRADPGTPVRVLYRGGQWFQVEGENESDETVTGWVYRDWIRIAQTDEARLGAYPDALPVIVTKITQSNSGGKKYWSGQVMNIGAKPAYDVQVEINLTGYVGNTETNAARGIAFVETRNLEPGQTAKFVVVTDFLTRDEAYYSHRVLWSTR